MQGISKLTLSVSDVRKFFRQGDQVKVTRGRYKGETGIGQSLSVRVCMCVYMCVYVCPIDRLCSPTGFFPTFAHEPHLALSLSLWCSA